jgi:probable phosphoglycerate mutase
MKTLVYLIRHGETDWNLERRWQGHTDIPLNTIGKQQSKRLAERLCTEQTRFDVLYSSDLTRAYQTAWEIGSALHVPVEMLPPLREIDLGIWSGLTREEIREQFPVEFALLSQGQDIPRGGGETLAALRARVVNTIEAMVAQHPGETLAFVSHGGAIRMMLRYVCETFNLDNFPCKHIGNTAISLLHHSVKDGWELLRCNDMAHLEPYPELYTAPPDDAERPKDTKMLP